MTVRYMGTKRHMAEHVRDAVVGLQPEGRVVDLFSGMGSVAESLVDTSSVVTNDALSFIACVSRARFTGKTRSSTPTATIRRLKQSFDDQLNHLSSKFETALKAEDTALAGEREDLALYIDQSKHVGNSPALRRAARVAAQASAEDHYQLASLYFGAGYLSLRQATETDALRAAIDADHCLVDRDWLLAAWIAAVSVLLNAPGHTAQFLRPNTESGYQRIKRTWQRSIWTEFASSLVDMGQIGSASWRGRNTVYTGDALDLIGSGELANIGAIYADPPYTKDQYSRYYHVYETLHRYDYPDSHGAGRSRSDRFVTGFSLKTAVVASFHDLCRNVARMGAPLVLSYPSAGLLNDAGSEVHSVASEYFPKVVVQSFHANHSTMGASNGASKKSATENLYVCSF